jgi:uncharacterized repeat protein (TIGR01451 family)
MAPSRRRLLLRLLLAASLCPLCGCFGITQNPSYFPWLLPTEDIIRTHAKPPGTAYYANFDPNAVRLEVRPVQQTSPVRTQLVVIATVYDGDGENAKPRRNRRVEWVVEGVGHIVEVDEAGCWPGRGYKVDSKYAVSYTNYHEHRITRGTADPADDFVVRPGQTWCVITSAVEGDTYVTAYAPGVYNWQKSRVFVTYHWVDAAWEFPPPAQDRAGAEHVLTTRVFRSSDRQPLANYRVRYRLLDGPPAVLITPGGRGTEAVAISDLSGNASVGLAEVTPQIGTNRVSIEIIRPPDPTSPGGVGLVLAQGETSVEWLAPAVALTHEGPPAVSPGQEFAFTTRVKNTGRVESRSMTVTQTVPPGLKYLRSVPPAVVDGPRLVWTLGRLPPGQEHAVQAFFQAGPPGTITSVATVETEEQLRDQATATTQVTEPRLKVVLDAPPTGVVGAPVTYQITVTNTGTGPANNVKLAVNFPGDLKHASGAVTLTMALGTLAPLDSRVVQPPLVLTPAKAGQFETTATVTADGGLSDTQKHVLTVQRAQMSLQFGNPPSRKYGDRSVEWNIHVKNDGEAPLNNVVVHDRLPPELVYENSRPSGLLTGGEVVWTVGTLAPGADHILQVWTRTAKAPGKVLHVVTATADPSVKAEAQAPLEILGLAALRLEAVDIGDPCEVGKQVTYQIEVKNTGSLPANQVEIQAFLPPELEPVTGNGPTPAKIEKQLVTFGKLDALQPDQEAKYTIIARAVKAGDVRFRVRLNSLALRQPVEEEESTTITAPSGPAPAPARPAAGAAAPGGAPPPPPPPPPAAASAVPQIPTSGVPPVPPPKVPTPPR